MKSAVNSFKVDRLKSVLDMVASRKRISLAELEENLDVSRVTVQRDLVELEKRKLLRRFHGGAMSLDYSGNLYDIRLRKATNVEVKKAIAKKAVSLIKPKSYLGMDASSTAYYISEQVLPQGLFILACGMEAFSNLASNSGLEVVLSGGRLNRRTDSLTGTEAIEMIKKFHFDLVFISAEAYVPGAGFFDPYEDEVFVKRALIESSARTVMLIDSSKVKHAGGVKICGREAIDFLVTDDPPDRNFKVDFKKKVL